MKSSGGVAPIDEVGGAGAQTVLSGPAGGAVGAGLLARLSGDGERRRPRHGRHVLRRLRRRGRLGAPHRLAGDRRAGDPAADGRRPHRRRRRRLDRLARRGRRAARRARAPPAPSPGPACYGRGGTEPTVTDANLLLGYLDADSALAGGVALDADAATERGRRACGDALGLDETGDGRGDRPRRQPGDDPGAAGGHGRARRRPARVRADAVRRRRADARGRDRRGARRRAAAVPAGQRRALRARPDRVGAAPRHGPHGDAPRRRADAERIAAEVEALRESIGAGMERGRGRGDLRAALPRPGVRAAGRRARSVPTRRAGGAVRGRARAPLRLPRPGRRGRAGQRPPGARRAGARRIPRPRPTGEARARHPARPLRRRMAARREVLRGEPGAGRRGRGPVRLRAAGGDPGAARRAGAAEVDEHGTIVGERGRDERARPGRPPGPGRRAALRLRGDGRGAGPLGALGEHQGAARLLDGAVRPGGRAGHAGRAHPGAPRLDARRGRGRARRSSARATSGSSTTPTAAAPTCPTSP